VKSRCLTRRGFAHLAAHRERAQPSITISSELVAQQPLTPAIKLQSTIKPHGMRFTKLLGHVHTLMTTQSWIYVVAGLVVATIAMIHFLTARKTRSKLTRQSLPFCIGQLVISLLIGVFFFSEVLSVMYFVIVALIYVPMVVWIVRLPKHDHMA
jgi:membrane-associated HD superfamily phosphohydrolase